MLISRSFGTHDGSFHADEVTACALLLLFHQIDRDKIYRTRNLELLSHCDYVCDVGGLYDPKKKRFDHHQVEYQGPLSSAGMILLYLKEQEIISSFLYDYFNQTIILGVDAHDTGCACLEIGVMTFSQVVSNFLPIPYEVTAEEMLNAFFVAVDFVIGHLDRLQGRFAYAQKCKDVVKDAMSSSQTMLMFDHSLPWMENFFDLGGERHSAQFVIMPSGLHWKLRGIPPDLAHRMKVRTLLPESWAGLHDQDLQRVSGITGAIFCHKGLFISIWETKEDAIKAFHIAMSERNHKH
jgi:uncharacterized UPF0160 family protein